MWRLDKAACSIQFQAGLRPEFLLTRRVKIMKHDFPAPQSFRMRSSLNGKEKRAFLKGLCHARNLHH
jgi:hypothetical protein